MLAVVVAIVPLERAGVGMGGLGEIGLPLLAMRPRVDLQQLHIVGAGDRRGGTGLQQVGEPLQRLRGGIGPRLPAPPAARLLQQEQRIAPLHRRGTEIGPEGVAVGQPGPGGVEAPPVVGKFKLPRHIANQFATMGAAGELSRLIGEGARPQLVPVPLFIVPQHGKEELPLRIPQQRLQAVFQPLGLFPVDLGQRGLAGQLSDAGNGPGVGPHVGVERRAERRGPAENVAGLPTVDVELHPVIVAGLPEQSDFGDEVAALPPLVVAHQVGKQVDQERVVGMHQVHRPRAVGEPGAVIAGLRSRCAEPVAEIVAGNPGRSQPPGLIQLVSRRATDRPVGPRPERTVDEFGEGVPRVGGPVGQVLGEQLPAVVPGGHQVGIGAVKQRNLAAKPLPIPVVPELLALEFPLGLENLGRHGVQPRAPPRQPHQPGGPQGGPEAGPGGGPPVRTTGRPPGHIPHLRAHLSDTPERPPVPAGPGEGEPPGPPGGRLGTLITPRGQQTPRAASGPHGRQSPGTARYRRSWMAPR